MEISRVSFCDKEVKPTVAREMHTICEIKPGSGLGTREVVTFNSSAWPELGLVAAAARSRPWPRLAKKGHFLMIVPNPAYGAEFPHLSTLLEWFQKNTTFFW